MAQIPLPVPQYNYGGLTLPVAPSNPPVPTDIVNAERLAQLAGTEYLNRTINANAFAEIIRYRNDVQMAIPPAWFAPAIAAALAPFQQQLGAAVAAAVAPAVAAALVPALAPINQQLVNLSNNITRLRIQQAQTTNQSLSGTAITPFVQVPFQDGTDPWNTNGHGANQVAVVLPPLNTVQAVRQLVMQEAYAYFRGYYPGIHMPAGPNALGLRIDDILAAIGRGDLRH
ncbi:hypothetical protein C8J56DRAFT_1164831 [Mycena floridula]|nr:hypothetical protein C8J56DRAFT_1164831 [Mycena floridula]